jgi:hypothetical protein
MSPDAAVALRLLELKLAELALFLGVVLWLLYRSKP